MRTGREWMQPVVRRHPGARASARCLGDLTRHQCSPHQQSNHTHHATDSHVGDAGIQPLLRLFEEATKLIQQAALSGSVAPTDTPSVGIQALL